jgi:hypothetical protein
MNPIQYLMMYEHWIEDLTERHKFARNYSILTGSFTNMELAQKMLDSDSGHSTYQTTDFDESIRIIEEDINREKVLKDQQILHRRRRKNIIR